LHGGIVGALIDEISGRAHMGSDPSAPRFMFTAKLEIRTGATCRSAGLADRGKAGKSRGKSAEAWAGIYLEGDDELLAEGTSLLIDVQRNNSTFTPGRAGLERPP